MDKQVNRATSIRIPCETSCHVVSDCLDDPKGDKLDAVLCAMQAAWSWSQRQARYGVPNDCDLLEGWIVDPCLSVLQPAESNENKGNGGLLTHDKKSKGIVCE